MEIFKSLFLATVLCFGFSSAFPTFRELSYIIFSTLRVGDGLCLSRLPMDAQFASDYFKCYDYPGSKEGEQEIWAKCQEEVFGSVSNTSEGIRSLCRTIYRFPRYVICVANKLRPAGINFLASATNVNSCKEKLLIDTGRYRQ